MKKLLPRIEVMLILVFLAFFALWSVGRCNATRAQYRAAAEEEAREERTPAMPAPSSAQQPPAADTLPQSPTATRRDMPTGSRLYIVIDGVNVRENPALNGKIIDRLKLFEEVAFLDEVTDFTQEIKLGETLTTNEPWVKIRTPKGRTGWVYGAGVHYHKRKLEGVE